MDQLLPRKSQDIDRWSDESERSPGGDAATGPQDRWANESVRGDPDYPAPSAGEGGTDAVNASLEDDGQLDDRPDDPAIHGQAR